MCEYYAHEDCKDFAVNDCRETATYAPTRDNVNLYLIQKQKKDLYNLIFLVNNISKTSSSLA